MNATANGNTTTTTTTEPKKQTAIIETRIDNDGSLESALRLRFIDGRELVVQINALHDDIIRQATLHGLKQKLVDAAAISRDPTNGRAATVDTKYDAVKEVFDRLTGDNPQWNKTREGGTGTGGLLFQALCRMYTGKKTPDDITGYLAGKSDAEKTALRKNPKVAAIIDAIRAEQGKAAKIDTDELLGELDTDD